MIIGYGSILGIAKIWLKIFKLVKEVLVFVRHEKNFNHEFLICLDLISKSRLCQNENLEITQELYSKGNYRSYSFAYNSITVNSVELETDLPHLDKIRFQKINSVIRNFNNTFATNIYRKPYRCNIINQEEIENQVNKLLEAGLIEESCAAPITLAYKRQSDRTKKNNKLCIGHTFLNKIIVFQLLRT